MIRCLGLGLVGWFGFATPAAAQFLPPAPRPVSTSLPAPLPLHGGVSAYPFLPATVARQSALPLVQPPISPWMVTPRYSPVPWYPNFVGGFWYSWGFSWDRGIPLQVTNYNIQVLPQPAPLVPATANRARLSLEVPWNAEVWLQGKLVAPFVGKRIFESPDLQPGERYTFDVRVTWLENGKTIEQKEQLDLKAGQHRGLLYIAAPPEAAKGK